MDEDKSKQLDQTSVEEPDSVHQGILDAKGRRRSPWLWVPTAYYAEGLPYIIINVVSVVMYQRMGVSNKDIAFFTSWLYLPWMLKPLWSPLVDLLKTKRWWIIIMQLFIGIGLGLLGLAIPMAGWFRWTMTIFWIMAFCSATHDIACDGFYMLGLSKHQQAWFVGVRSTFYRLAMLTGTGLLVILAGYIESHSGLPSVSLEAQASNQARQQQALEMFKSPSLSLEPEIAQMASGVQPESGEPRLVFSASNDQLLIPIQGLKSTDSKQIIDNAKAWNLAQGQPAPVEAEKKVEEQGFIGKFWSKSVSQPLGTWLKGTFAPKPPAPREMVGNIGLAFLHLSAPPEPGKTVSVNFGRKSGDKSINLVVGTRFVFDEENWNKPVVAVVQLHHNLREERSAEFKATAGNIPLSWVTTMLILFALFIILFIYHSIVLPAPLTDVPGSEADDVGKGVWEHVKEVLIVFGSFFQKRGIIAMLAFLLLYRLAEAQLVKLAQPFLLDSQENGGLALTTGQVGTAYGIVGLVSLTIGGILGGFMAARDGLKKWIWFMAIAINLPDAVYIYLSQVQPDSLLAVNLCVGIEQFGYGFGFTAYMLYMIFCAEGKHKTVHFAMTTAFMAAGMMIPGMFSGWIQENIGYKAFFIWVMIATIPGFLTLLFIPLDPKFGKKEHAA